MCWVSIYLPIQFPYLPFLVLDFLLEEKEIKSLFGVCEKSCNGRFSLFLGRFLLLLVTFDELLCGKLMLDLLMTTRVLQIMLCQRKLSLWVMREASFYTEVGMKLEMSVAGQNQML